MKRFIVILTTGAFLQACMHWGTKPIEPERFDGATPDRRVRVTLADGGILVVKNPFISGDSLVWLRAVPDDLPASDAPLPARRQGIPSRRSRRCRSGRLTPRERRSSSSPPWASP